MQGNYIAVFIHSIWTTKCRLPVLPKSIRYPLYEHIRENAMKKGIDLRIVNGVDDHAHCVFRLLSTQTFSRVIKNLKGESSKWLNDTFFVGGDWNGYLEKMAKKKGIDPLYYASGFSWQTGYGAVSVSPQNVGKAVQYVFNQERHHAENGLEDELKLFRYYSDMDWEGLEEM
ncbi:MAG TPA: transposase [Bacteroidetes bacterium]|nr:transposase [Bacteroidota bacterium]